MKRIEFGQALGILANVGVLIGILLLVYELNQNREMMRAQTRNEMAQGLVFLATQNLNDPDWADLRRRGDSGEELATAELYQYVPYLFSWFRFWENQHYQYRLGLYDEAEFLKQREAYRNALANRAGWRWYWCRNRATYSLEFAADMDQLLLEAGFTCEGEGLGEGSGPGRVVAYINRS